MKAQKKTTKSASKHEEEYKRCLQMKESLEKTLQDLSAKIKNEALVNTVSTDAQAEMIEVKVDPRDVINNGKSTGLPSGWRMKTSGFIISPAGLGYKTRFVAVQDMIKRNYPGDQVEEMKKMMIENEGWELSDHLPQGWMFKVHWEGFTKDKRYQNNILYLSREGQSFESMKKVIEFIGNSDNYSLEEAAKCQDFLTDRAQVTKLTKYDWEKSDSVPTGWKVRKDEAKFILSPSGQQFKSRFAAFQDLVARQRHVSRQEIMEMKSKMIEYENWEFSDLLPEGWLFKCVSDGSSKWNSKLNFLSSEGLVFDTMKDVMMFMESQSSNYNYEDLDNCKEFLKQRNSRSVGDRFCWEDTNTLPRGWKIRNSESKQQFILSPHGVQYKTRFSAIQDMIKKSDVYSTEMIESMRHMMILHESWETSPLLPTNWLFKVIWEGKVKSKSTYQSSVYFLSSEGFYFTSAKNALDYLKATEYSEEDVDNFLMLQQSRRKSCGKLKYAWEEGDETLPDGWLMRRAEGKSEMEFILSPEGEQHRSRSVAYQSLCRSNADQAIIDAMRSKLHCEGWETNDLLPPGWVLKKTFEGTDKNGRLIVNIKFLSVEGRMFESVKEANMFMDSMPDYTKGDQENIRKIQQRIHKDAVSRREDWVVDTETLPRGWKKRSTEKQEFIMRPDGRQFRSRLAALQTLIRERCPHEDIFSMMSVLHHEGWTQDTLLPVNWFFKKTQSSYDNRSLMDYEVLSSSGDHFMSLKAASKFMMSNKFPQQQIDNFDSFTKLEFKNNILTAHTWSDDDSLPGHWKMRQGQGKTFYLSPEGQQFLSILTSVQHMVENNHSQDDVHKMRLNLEQEGWQNSEELPRGWQEKITKSHTYYLGRRGEFFTSARVALEQIEYSGDYDCEEVELIRGKAEGEVQLVEDKYRWSEKETLPAGWRARRKMSSSRKMIEWFLAPDGKHIRGKNSALQHLKTLGAKPEDIVKMKSFSWFKKAEAKKQQMEDSSSNTSMLLSETINSSIAQDVPTLEEECQVSSTTSDDYEGLVDSTVVEESVDPDIWNNLKELEAKMKEISKIESKLGSLQGLLSRKRPKFN